MLESTERTLIMLRECEGAVHTAAPTADEALAVTGTWMTLVSYVEFYADEAVERLMLSAEENSKGLALKLIKEHRKQAFRNWDSRTKVIDTVLSIQTKSWNEWPPFHGAVWVRNGIAHGQGGLSRMQKRGEAHRAKAVGVSLVDNSLIVTTESLRKCMLACVDFVTRIDAEMNDFYLRTRA